MSNAMYQTKDKIMADAANQALIHCFDGMCIKSRCRAEVSLFILLMIAYISEVAAQDVHAFIYEKSFSLVLRNGIQVIT